MTKKMLGVIRKEQQKKKKRKPISLLWHCNSRYFSHTLRGTNANLHLWEEDAVNQKENRNWQKCDQAKEGYSKCLKPWVVWRGCEGKPFMVSQNAGILFSCWGKLKTRIESAIHTPRDSVREFYAVGFCKVTQNNGIKRRWNSLKRGLLKP